MTLPTLVRGAGLSYRSEMSEPFKWILVGALIVVGLNLFFFAHVKRRIAAAKEEGYRRQAADDRMDGGE